MCVENEGEEATVRMTPMFLVLLTGWMVMPQVQARK